MKITEKELILNGAVAIQWAAIKELKVLETKLLVVLEDGVTVELTGLDPKVIDAAFVAYSRSLNPTQSPHSPKTAGLKRISPPQ